MGKGTLNRHRGLADGALPRRYLRRHERDGTRDIDKDDAHCWDYYYDGVDDYWDPDREATDVDFELWRVWQDVLAVGVTPWLDVRWAQAAEPELQSPPPGLIEASGDVLAAALHEHLQQIASNACRPGYLNSAAFTAARGQLRQGVRKYPALLTWFNERPGPGVMVFLLAPFWIRSLDTWSAPVTKDIDAVGRSLLDHLLFCYRVPEALYQPWRSDTIPSLKWVSWVLLLGRGASLPRAGSRFGWSVPSKLVAHLQSAPSHLTPVEALVWAEITRVGGTQRDFDRLRLHPGYLFDLTTSPGEAALRFEDERTATPAHSERNRRFLQSTIEWFVRHRDELDDLYVQLILDWALHCHTEDLGFDERTLHGPVEGVGPGVPERARFSWRGRTVAATRDRAVEYRDAVRGGWPQRLITWRPRGWDWEIRFHTGLWTVRELTSSTELVEESRAMHHCVASYAYRCAQGGSAIFSLSLDQVRRATVEVFPVSRRIVQARGPCNRSCDPQELDVLERWLKSLSAPARNSEPPSP